MLTRKSNLECILPKQPYFFVMDKTAAILEYQAFSGRLVDVFNGKTIVSSIKRRTDFNGQTIRASIDKNEPFKSFNSEIAEMLRETFNFTLEYSHDSNIIYGHLSENGTWSGMIKGLLDNDLDVCKLQPVR